MTSHLPKPTPGKNLSQQFKENVIYLIVTYFILAVIFGFLKLLFSPFSLSSREEAEEKIKEMIRDKIRAREKRAEHFENDYNDPMHQFQLRFIDDPDSFKDDPDNAIYEEWFKEWKKGNIIDSNLRWAPSIYEDAFSSVMRVSFIDYLKIQLDLHKRSSIANKIRFLQTIEKYYPEFSSSMSGLEEDLAHYEAELTETIVIDELQKEIQKFGLSEDMADYLMDNASAETLKEKALFLKACTENNITSSAGILALEHNLTIQDALVIGKIVELGLPARVGLAYLHKELTTSDLNFLVEKMNSVLEDYGTDAFSFIKGTTRTAYDDYLEYYLKDLRHKNAVKRF